VVTLHADEPLEACLRSLRDQTITDFDIIVVDNSGRRLVAPDAATQVIYNDRNLGFGAAVNQAFRASTSPFIATLNDDAVAEPRWLESLLGAIEQRYEIGMCASQVRLDAERLDSAGMLICRDGTSKQRGHLEPPSAYSRPQEVLLPSASAALYRRDMLDEIGLFDEDFFLYCEDTDLGLRARWAAWECRYAPNAVVEHRYSHSAGKASGLKAYFVERNRLYVIFKNFPVDFLALVPFYAIARYFWHAVFALQGRGTAASYGREGNSMAKLPWLVLRAHAELTRHAFRVWRRRRTMKRRLTPKQFRKLLRFYSIGPKQVAAL
jgi:GT2 family glycosyltransferase